MGEGGVKTPSEKVRRRYRLVVSVLACVRHGSTTSVTTEPNCSGVKGSRNEIPGKLTPQSNCLKTKHGDLLRLSTVTTMNRLLPRSSRGKSILDAHNTSLSHRSLSFSFFRFHYMIPPDCLLLLLSISVFTF